MRKIKNQAAALAALTALGVLTSCSNDDSKTPTASDPTSAGSATSTTAEATTTATPNPGYTMVAETYLTGPGRWAVRAIGDPKAPLAVFDVPEGYDGRESYVWTHDELDLVENRMGQVLYFAPTRVHADPCNVKRPSPRLGPTVEDLANALVAQKRTTTTRPVPVTLGGYRGLYLELSTPKSVVSGACAPLGGMAIFEAGPDGGRALEYPATERYWILDIKGRRVLITAMTPLGARSKSVKRVTDVAEKITFVEAAR